MDPQLTAARLRLDEERRRLKKNIKRDRKQLAVTSAALDALDDSTARHSQEAKP